MKWHYSASNSRDHNLISYILFNHHQVQKLKLIYTFLTFILSYASSLFYSNANFILGLNVFVMLTVLLFVFNNCRLYISYTCPYAQRAWITRNCKVISLTRQIMSTDWTRFVVFHAKLLFLLTRFEDENCSPWH